MTAAEPLPQPLSTFSIPDDNDSLRECPRTFVRGRLTSEDGVVFR